MTQEEKQLLLIDLCMRLPYKVKVLDDLGRLYELHIGDSYIIDLFYGNGNYIEPPVKPYLRPMSSMTEKEKDELLDLCDMYDPYHDTDPYDDWGIQMFTQHVHSDTAKYIAKNLGAVMDWLNAHHFDYNGLIPMGLALEAKKGMYN